MLVYVSGCHSGPNPSPGLGVARSLREAFPSARLLAKDHSVECSALHDPVFDDVWVCRPWDELDLTCHRKQIERRLASGAVFISGLDLEAVWLARQGVRGALVPPAHSVDRVAKPAIIALANLPGVAVPAWCHLAIEPRELRRFARRYDWRLWVKGPSYDARLAKSWEDLEEARSSLARTWGAEGLYAQADVRGHEVSIAIGAFRGELLDAVYMEKRVVTEQGKTWAGAISDPEPALVRALRSALAVLGWTGGVELEFVRDDRGVHWLIDFNPRFPAWIHGATIAGRNLPARLVSAATDLPMRPAVVRAAEFTRVIVEIPVRSEIPLSRPRAVAGEPADASDGKHPSGMPRLQRRLTRNSGRSSLPEPFNEPWVTDVLGIAASRRTPFRWLLEQQANTRFERCSAFSDALSNGVPVRIAYSIKTNPDRRLLILARRWLFLAEVISHEERALALDVGFLESEIIHNGPVPPAAEVAPLSCRAAFADSIEGLGPLIVRVHGVVGARVRPPGITSRFGIDLEDPSEFAACLAILNQLAMPLGLSMHIQSSAIGVHRWARAVRATIEFAVTVAKITGRPVECLDLGGGWASEDFEELFETVLPALADSARRALPELREIILEPGKLLAEPTAVTVVRVVERRVRRQGVQEVVVDGSVAELPTCQFHSHRVVAAGRHRPELLGIGNDRILGRLCLESDVLRPDVHLPEWLKVDDYLVFCETGGYDVSMSYPFGIGDSDG